MSARTGFKTCYHCDVELPELIDTNDHLGGLHGACEACRKFINQKNAELMKRLCVVAVPEVKT